MTRGCAPRGTRTPYRAILTMLRGLGPLDIEFLADHLGCTVADTRVLLATLRRTGAVTARGDVVRLTGDARRPTLDVVRERRARQGTRP